MDVISFNFNNPYFNKSERHLNIYFALSYDHDVMNPVDNPSEIKITYNERIIIIYPSIDNNVINILTDNIYNSKFTLQRNKSANLVLNFIVNEESELHADISFEQIYYIDKINLNKKYVQKVIDKSHFDDEENFEYQIEFNTEKKLNSYEYSCIFFYYKFTDENININDFDQYNSFNKIINIEDNKISWNKLSSINYYEIYMVNYSNSRVKKLFNNDCYLSYLRNQSDSGIKIINTTNNFYEFEKTNHDLIINVIGIDNKSNMKILYNSAYFVYDTENETNYTIIIVSIVLGVILLIVGIFVGIIIYRKYKLKNKQEIDYDILKSNKLLSQ